MASNRGRVRRLPTYGETRQSLAQLMPALRSLFGVRELSVFGSFVREEQNRRSDLDVLVEFDAAPDLLEFIRLENYLSDTLGVKVDLVMKDALKARIRNGVLREAQAV